MEEWPRSKKFWASLTPAQRVAIYTAAVIRETVASVKYDHHTVDAKALLSRVDGILDKEGVGEIFVGFLAELEKYLEKNAEPTPLQVFLDFYPTL